MAQSTVLFDDNCSKCRGWAKFIETRDPDMKIRLIGQNTDEGRGLLKARPQPQMLVDSVFLLSPNGNWYSKTDAVWRICRLLVFPWTLGSILWLVPARVRNLAYDIYASRRRPIQ
ncbi:MAG: DCC1-like thiol-disulfide oxidoreductase family protein [Candidatus Thalassarchaeaceae archaeon]|jgi:predicted DCC family thiol-disulfide oxidoreductase YuxK|nr:DCC1-like thiol-disulfide oxidoreductase family protein [Candidatus Thalassarchaeaceae archaeon]